MGLPILLQVEKVVPYLFIENIDEDDLTLIDPSFLLQLPILEDYIHNLGYKMKDIKRIVLTHLHIDHAQAANEIRNRTGANLFSLDRGSIFSP